MPEAGPAGAARAARETVSKVTGHPADELGCPWASFYDREVLAVVEAHGFWPNLSIWLGDDPEAWLVEGVNVYHRALEASRADASELLRKRAK